MRRQITEFGSPESLVVTPEKMLSLYTKYKIEPERFQYEGQLLVPLCKALS